LLRRPPRSPSGYRAYAAEDLARLSFIKRAQALGFTLDEIKELLELRIDARNPCERVLARTEAKIAVIDRKLDDLRRIKAALARLVAACRRRAKHARCPILDSLEAGTDREST
jgi:MerR family mercuric resistance operon transcriptional regulator